MNQPENEFKFGQATIKGTIWQYLTFFSGKLMVLISTAILARLLSQNDFGVVGYALTAISFLDVISDLGIVTAIIYYPEKDRNTSTGFWLNLLIGTMVFGLTWIAAPWIGLYFRDPRAVTAIQIMGLVYPIRALGDTHDAVLSKRLEFGRLFIPEFLQGFGKGLFSIVFALLGFGASSLIWGYISGTLLSSIAYWFITPWRPSLTFDWQTARDLVKYGLGIVSVSIVSIFLVNLDYLLIGRYMGAAALGVYSLAYRLPDLLVLQFARVLSNVIFPIYTHIRAVKENLKHSFLLTTRYLSLVTVPLGVGLALTARPITIAFFSEKWESAIPVIQGLALYSMFLTLSYPAGSIYKAEGQPQILTKLGLIRLTLLFPALWWAVTVARSIDHVSWLQAMIAFIGTVMNLYVAARLIQIPVLELLDSFRPSFVASAVMSVGVMAALFGSRFLNPWWQLSTSIITGAIIYTGVLFVFERELLMTIAKRLQNALKKREHLSL